MARSLYQILVLQRLAGRLWSPHHGDRGSGTVVASTLEGLCSVGSPKHLEDMLAHIACYSFGVIRSVVVPRTRTKDTDLSSEGYQRHSSGTAQDPSFVCRTQSSQGYEV